jgi:hypothetical protein
VDRTALITLVSDLGYTNTSAITSALQRTYRRVLGMRRWDFLEAQTTDPIAAGDTTIARPADARRIDAIELTDASGLSVDFEYRTYQQFRDHAKWAQDEGVPQWWTERGGVIYIWPKADGAYTATIDYVKNPPNYLDAGTDEPIFPEVFHDILVYGAAVDMASRERDDASIGIFSNQFTTRLSEMIAEHGVRQRQTSTHVRRSKFWRSVRAYG